MGIKPIQVDESKKDDPDVQKTTVPVTVGGSTVEVTTYMRLELFDDLDPAIKTDIMPDVQFLYPSWGELEYTTGKQNADGSDEIAVRRYLKLERRTVDLGPDSVARLQEALQPFMDVSAPVKEPEVPEQPKRRGRPRKTAQTAPSE